MSTGDFSFSLNVPGSSPTPQKRYIARPFEAHPTGEEVLILASGEETGVRAPLFYAQMLARLGEFRILDGHAEDVVRTFGLPAEQKTAVRQGLQGLVQRGLLEDEEQVFRRLGKAEDSESPVTGPIATLCIRTCNRPRDLGKLLASLRHRAAASGLERVLILDDSTGAGAGTPVSEVIAAAGLPESLEIVHIDRGTRARLVRTMAAEARVDPARLEWLIEGDPDDPAASYGANLNLALLLTAGERFAMIDDDARLDPYALEPPRAGLRLRVTHEFEVRFPDPPEAETGQFQALDLDPLAAHGALLGQPVSVIARRYGLQDGRLLRGLSPQMIHDFSMRPRVRLTTNGTLGDSGTGGMLWQYTLPAEQLRPWLSGPEDYERLAFSRRVARSTRETEIASSVSLMTTTLTGVDNRELLLPVPARGRGEDLVFGAAIRFLYPGTPCAALPWMLPHRMDSPRRWNREDFEQRRGTGLAAYLSARIEAFGDARLPTEPIARSDVLSGWLRGLGRMREPELVVDLRRDLLERRAAMAEKIHGTLVNLNPPDWLRAEFESILDRHRRIGPEDTASLERLAPKVGRFAGMYGAALGSWASVWTWAAAGGARAVLGPRS